MLDVACAGSAVSYETEGFYSSAVIVGDLNGDGILDLVTSGAGDGVYGIDGYASVRLGRGDGSFEAATSYLAEDHSSRAVTLGDLNGDGILDLVTAGYYGINAAQVTVRLGKGNGDFGAMSTYFDPASATEGNDVVLGDVNGDGILDVVISGSLYDDSNGHATVWFGRGDGTLAHSGTYDMETGPSTGLALADLNGDGFLDMATAGRGGGSGRVTIRIGTGDGTFSAAKSYSASSSLRDLALGDLNGDGVLDLVATGYHSYNVSTFLGATSDGVAPLLPFSLKTLADARQALPVFQRKREQLAAQRGEIGAFQSRIDVAKNVLQVSSENFKAADFRIRNSDIADESSRLVRLNILQQAASSVLAQANQQPALALQLLSG